ncbi:MAG: exosome complex RNA-binding protein Rrp4 [Candidatus Nanoarchaeia archaeon]|jgi:exosome complex component RRP4
MSKGILVEDKNLVIPGDVIAQGMEFLPGHGTHRISEEIRSSVLGLVDAKGSVIRVIPLKGAYMPRPGDKVIGKVIDTGYSVWDVDIKAPVKAILGVAEATNTYIELGEDLSRYYAINDYVYAEVERVSKPMFIRLNMKDRMFKKLEGGLVVEINPMKVPRVIGKKGSMVNTLKDETGCFFIIGQNGIVWIKGETRKQELLAVKALKFIEENAHLKGLTDTIKEKIGEWKK